MLGAVALCHQHAQASAPLSPMDPTIEESGNLASSVQCAAMAASVWHDLIISVVSPRSKDKATETTRVRNGVSEKGK